MRSTHEDLPLTYVKNVPSGAADDVPLPLVIILHGRGADANDLADLASMVEGDYRFLFPNAPRPFEMGSGMTWGFTWFDGWPPVEGSIAPSRSLLLEFIEAASARYPTPRGQVILGGFSQGGLMSIDAGFRTAQALAGIVVLSGAAYEEELPDLSAHTAQPILIIHGTHDEVIPINTARRTRIILEEKGLNPEYHELPIGHQVSEEEMRIVSRFLASSIHATKG